MIIGGESGAAMFDRNLRRYCESVVRAVPVPRPFSAHALCQELSAKSSRRIYLHPYAEEMSGEGMPCGVWLATGVADHIFFEKSTSQYHQNHIILHEIGHMLCQHRLHDLADTALGSVDGLTGDDLVATGRIRGVLQRTSYTTRQEREAELVASLILERAMAWDGNAAGTEERYLGEVLGFL